MSSRRELDQLGFELVQPVPNGGLAGAHADKMRAPMPKFNYRAPTPNPAG
jgi:hypothetical protein